MGRIWPNTTYLGHPILKTKKRSTLKTGPAQLLARLKIFVEQVTRFLPRHLPFVFLKKWGA